jgi:hypothetical protein
MREFNLASIDWDSVRLMQAGQFKQETYYLEELVRWVLQRGRIYGLLHLTDEGISRPSPEGGAMYSVVVRGCFGVADAGSIIEIPDDPALALRGTIEARGNLVPLYIGTSRIERAADPELYPSVDVGLLQCGGRRRLYTLSSDDADTNFDWLQIAQYEKTPMGLSLDGNYIPECMFLSSYGGMWQTQKGIQQLAVAALKTLQQHSDDVVAVFSAASSLAASLGPAGRKVDERLHPRAYMDQMAGVLTAQRYQLGALPKPNDILYQQTLDQLDRTLSYFDTEWTPGQAFLLVRECFERLLNLYPILLQSLHTVTGPQETRKLGFDTVVSANNPDGSYTQTTPNDNQSTTKKSQSFWRK